MTDARRVRALVPLGLEDEFDPPALVAAAAAAARETGASLEVVIIGDAPEEKLGLLALGFGARTVWLARHPGLAAPVGATQACAAFAEVLHSFESSWQESISRITLLPPCTAGEEIAARLAVRFDGAALGRIADLRAASEGFSVTKAGFGGRAKATLDVTASGFGVIRFSRPPAIEDEAKGELRNLALNGPLPARAEIERTESASPQRRLEGARLVVSGGRGMGGPEGFALLQSLAEALGGALGGSLPTVDAGWVPVSRQVGQSGKFVTAAVYVAVGISGTPQHLAGIGPDTRIVALNSDPEAPIFRVAEVGCVADWRTVLPLVLTRLRP